MKWWWGIIFILVSIGAAVGVWLYLGSTKTSEIVSPVADLIPRPLDKYSIDSLSNRTYSSQIILDEAVATTSAFTAYHFHFDSDDKKVTGLAHIPTACLKSSCPVIVQFRGYVPLEIFKSGVGTYRSAEVYATNGFISLAPDFLGYGGSDNPSIDIFEARFETYTTALNLIAAVSTWDKYDGRNLFIWGHSNGGQIALTVLEILQQPIPAVLWAPVTKPFPYSILYYTDEADDDGKVLRKELARFEDLYDVFNYDLSRYLGRISAPVQLHQGLVDEAVPFRWSREFVDLLESLDKQITYYEYSGADHNLSGAWDAVVARDILWYNQYRVNEDID